MARFRLCDEDRARFGCPEWIEFNLRAISMRDLAELSDRFGFDPMDWPDPFLGEITFEQAGDPEAKPKPPVWHLQATAWQMLRQAGCDVSWDDAGEVRLFLADREADPEPERGKDDTADPTSPKLATSTTRRSSTSSRGSSTRKRT